MKHPKPKRLPGFADAKRRRRRITDWQIPHAEPKPRVTEYGDIEPTTTKVRTR